eukprot:jgi/Mesvir1/13700/Mv02131-RA.1
MMRKTGFLGLWGSKKKEGSEDEIKRAQSYAPGSSARPASRKGKIPFNPFSKKKSPEAPPVALDPSQMVPLDENGQPPLFYVRHVDSKVDGFYLQAVAMLQGHDFTAVLENLDAALKRLEKISGKNHPDVVYCLSCKATVLAETCSFDDAESAATRALKIMEVSEYAFVPETAINLRLLLAVAARGRHLYDISAFHYKAAAKQAREELGPMHPKVASTLSSLAEMLGRSGQLLEASEAAGHALTIAIRVFGEEDPVTLGYKKNFDMIRFLLKRYGAIATVSTTPRKDEEEAARDARRKSWDASRDFAGNYDYAARGRSDALDTVYPVEKTPKSGEGHDDGFSFHPDVDRADANGDSSDDD